MNYKQKILFRIFVCIGVFAFLRHVHHVVYNASTHKDSYMSSNCNCVLTKTGESHNFCFADPQSSSSFGKKFNCSHLDVLENLNLIGDSKKHVNLSDSIKNEEEVVFVSATSDDHFKFSLKSFESVRKFYPNHKYVLYGLDLNSDSMDQLPNDRRFEFRKINTKPYPDYVNNWCKYHFKAILLAETIKEFPVIWWIDAHIALRKSNIIKNLFKEISENRSSSNYSSLISFRGASHSNYATLNLVAAGIMFLPRTDYTVKTLKWWVLCSLTEECMNPPGSQVECNFGLNKYDYYAYCFRYDQSVLNILLLNDFQHHEKYFMSSLENSFERIVSINSFPFSFNFLN